MHKTALGGEFTVDWKYVNNAVDVVDNLKNEGYIVYSVEQAEEMCIRDRSFFLLYTKSSKSNKLYSSF